MIRLDLTTRSLQIALGGAVTTNQVSCVASYSDKSSTAYSGGSQVGLSNNTTATTICAAPASGNIRDVDSMTVYNNDTVAATVFIYYNDNGTLATLKNALLQPKDSLIYTHGKGWETTDANGCIKTSITSQTATALPAVSALPNGTTATTQTPGDSTTKVATDAFVTAAIAAFSAATSTIYQVTVNLGSQPTRQGTFNITGAGFTPGQPVLVTQAATRTGSAYYDSIEMDQITAAGYVLNSTTIVVSWGCRTRVCNSYTFNYKLT